MNINIDIDAEKIQGELKKAEEGLKLFTDGVRSFGEILAGALQTLDVQVGEGPESASSQDAGPRKKRPRSS